MAKMKLLLVGILLVSSLYIIYILKISYFVNSQYTFKVNYCVFKFNQVVNKRLSLSLVSVYLEV